MVLKMDIRLFGVVTDTVYNAFICSTNVVFPSLFVHGRARVESKLCCNKNEARPYFLRRALSLLKRKMMMLEMKVKV